jgi:hypothetical protein
MPLVSTGGRTARHYWVCSRRSRSPVSSPSATVADCEFEQAAGELRARPSSSRADEPERPQPTISPLRRYAEASL